MKILILATLLMVALPVQADEIASPSPEYKGPFEFHGWKDPSYVIIGSDNDPLKPKKHSKLYKAARAVVYKTAECTLLFYSTPIYVVNAQ